MPRLRAHAFSIIKKTKILHLVHKSWLPVVSGFHVAGSYVFCVHHYLSFVLFHWSWYCLSFIHRLTASDYLWSFSSFPFIMFLWCFVTNFILSSNYVTNSVRKWTYILILPRNLFPILYSLVIKWQVILKLDLFVITWGL